MFGDLIYAPESELLEMCARERGAALYGSDASVPSAKESLCRNNSKKAACAIRNVERARIKSKMIVRQ